MFLTGASAIFYCNKTSGQVKLKNACKSRRKPLDYSVNLKKKH